MTDSPSPMGYAITIPPVLEAEMRERCLSGAYDAKRLQRELSHRLNTWVPSFMAEVLHDEFTGR